MKSGDSFEVASWSSALDAVARTVRHARPGSIAILGGARGTNEDAFMWAQLADALGVSMRDAQLDDGLPSEVFAYPQATIDAMAAASTVVLLAPDLKEELPVLYIRLRDAVQKKGVRIIEVSPTETGISQLAWRSVRSEAGTTATAMTSLLADATVAAQLSSGPVVVVAGRGNLAELATHTMSAIDAVIAHTPSATVLPVLRRGNVRGALTVGLAPQAGRDAANILEAASNGQVDCLILLGADPLNDVPDADLARRGMAGAKYVVAIDNFLTQSAAHADVVLPAAAYAEKDGTTMNLEGRVTNVAQKITPRGTSRVDWMIAAELGFLLGHDMDVTTLADVQKKMAKSVAGFGATTTAVAVKRDGIVVHSAVPAVGSVPAPVVTPRSSYDFRIKVSRKLYDKAVGTVTSPSMSQLAPGAGVWIHSLDLDRVGVAEGASVKVSNSHSSIVLPVFVSDNIPRGTASVPFNQPGSDIRELIRRSDDVVDVRIESM
jgi:NADH-quinone oxidoreductase subunit G